MTNLTYCETKKHKFYVIKHIFVQAQGVKKALEENVYPTFNVIEKRYKEKGGDFIIIKVKLI